MRRAQQLFVPSLLRSKLHHARQLQLPGIWISMQLREGFAACRRAWPPVLQQSQGHSRVFQLRLRVLDTAIRITA